MDGHESSTPANGHVWLKPREAAARARVGVKVIYRASRSGRLRTAVVDARRSLRYRAEWVDEWLERTNTPTEVRR